MHLEFFTLVVDGYDPAERRRGVPAFGAHGVHFVAPPRDEAYGRVAVFEDIAGNRWHLLGPRTPPVPVPVMLRAE